MNEELFHIEFHTVAGWIALLGSSTGLRRVTLPCKSKREALSRLGSTIVEAEESCYRFQDTIEQLNSYFNGNKVDFIVALDYTDTTHFQQEVWIATRLIPYGEIRSYNWVAEQIKRPRAARAVGQALGRNPLPVIIPCHRVLSSNGGLGGFTGGLEMKRFLLDLETKSGS
jgi:methylated-DNA-[protein]-cysteine S-methyltransferase